MAGRINDDDVQALRERADIAAVIGDYTSLKRAGTRLKGLCPFHEERTPSFTVDPSRGLYHCFGCQVGGDVYGFLQQVEALSFPEAVERLARTVGYELRYEQLSPGQRKALGRRTRLAEALDEAARFYERQLAGAEGAPARSYLSGRGVRQEDAEHFRLGWAPDTWDAMVGHLREAGFTAEEAVLAGLATEGKRGPIDRFRGRVIFPIIDKSGKDVVGFGGRILPGVELRTAPREGGAPKYINSPETEVYKKSQVLYALNWARAEIQRRDAALVVEGYMDVIGLHIAGVRHAVATCGTALTGEHFRQLEHFAPRVVLALDADDAGSAAADRARSLAEDVGVREVGVLPLPPGADPADLAAEGADRVEAALREVKTAVEFQIEHLLRRADVETPEGQVAAYRETFPLLARIGDRALRYRYIRDVVAPAVGLSADRIEEELDTELPSMGVPQEPPAAAPPPSPPGDVSGPAARLDPQMQLERDVLRAALQLPELLPPAWKLVTTDDFRAPMSQQLFAALEEAPAGDLTTVLASLPDDDARARVRALALSEPTVEPDAAHLRELVSRLRARSVEREHEAVKEQLRRVGEQLEPTERRRLQARSFDLERRRRELLEGRDACA
ncbi:MAG TPA: DNA primase [Egibacteraceae bacterium]|nr:DNA primase [Egibacteraceae bacterium]